MSNQKTYSNGSWITLSNENVDKAQINTRATNSNLWYYKAKTQAFYLRETTISCVGGIFGMNTRTKIESFTIINENCASQQLLISSLHSCLSIASNTTGNSNIHFTIVLIIFYNHLWRLLSSCPTGTWCYDIILSSLARCWPWPSWYRAKIFSDRIYQSKNMSEIILCMWNKVC